MEMNRVVVDLSAISHNVFEIRRLIGPNCLLMAVVKSDGYGHGAAAIAKTSIKSGADWLGVSEPQEGEALRRAGLNSPILVFGLVPPQEAERIIECGLRQTVTDMGTLRALNEEAHRQGKRAYVHLKIDTGMGRIGLRPEQVIPFILEAENLGNIVLEGMYSHLASADTENDEYTLRQIRVFNGLLAELRLRGKLIKISHLANSAATLQYPQAFYDLVRPGIMLYGLYPEVERSRSINLRPAMSLWSRVSHIKTVPPGTSIGYERRFIAPKATKVATIPLGYGNGYSRLFSNRGRVRIRGQIAPIIGNVCMNAFMVDVSAIDGIQAWDEVEIFGPQMPIHDVARTKGTIVQEIVSILGRINPRYYVGGS